MDKINTKLKFITLVFMITILLTTTALAANGYEINWWTVDGGGGTSESAGGQYVLRGAIGQPDAGNTTEGGVYTLRGGFWVDGILSIFEYIINLPLVLR